MPVCKKCIFKDALFLLGRRESVKEGGLAAGYGLQVSRGGCERLRPRRLERGKALQYPALP